MCKIFFLTKFRIALLTFVLSTGPVVSLGLLVRRENLAFFYSFNQFELQKVFISYYLDNYTMDSGSEPSYLLQPTTKVQHSDTKHNGPRIVPGWVRID